jgi:hypothetical protein
MEYIDKNKSRGWAHALIKDFLERRKREDGKYPDDLYTAFRADPQCKDDMVNKLMEDNGHRCCYCMASIKGTTIEHVILNSTKTQEDFDKYFGMDSELDRNNIRLATDFLANPSDVPPFPHTIAYENLIPSCFGYLPGCSSKCCNIYRGEKFVYPLVFRKNINSEVEYYSDGRVVWKEDPEDKIPTVTKLGLDCLELKAIRRIWYFLCTNGLTCEYRYKEKVVYTLIDELGDTTNNKEKKDMRNMLMNFLKTEYWNLLEKYQYFNDINKFI